MSDETLRLAERAARFNPVAQETYQREWERAGRPGNSGTWTLIGVQAIRDKAGRTHVRITYKVHPWPGALTVKGSYYIQNLERYGVGELGRLIACALDQDIESNDLAPSSPDLETLLSGREVQAEAFERKYLDRVLTVFKFRSATGVARRFSMSPPPRYYGDDD